MFCLRRDGASTGKMLAQEKKWYPSHMLMHESVSVSCMCGDVNCCMQGEVNWGHVSCVRNTTVDGVMDTC